VSRKVRWFTCFAAVGQMNPGNGEFTLAHGTVWPGEIAFSASCDWRHVMRRTDIEAARIVIAAHLNECPQHHWSTLPTVEALDRSSLPKLTDRDIMPGSNIDTETVIHFGITSEAFSI
jgi:hypothetical protein